MTLSVDYKQLLTRRNVLIGIGIVLFLILIFYIRTKKKASDKKPIQIVANSIKGMAPELAEKTIKNNGYIARFRGVRGKEIPVVSTNVRKDRINYWVNCYGAKSCLSSKVTETSVG